MYLYTNQLNASSPRFHFSVRENLQFAADCGPAMWISHILASLISLTPFRVAEKVYIGRVWQSWPTKVRVTIGLPSEMEKFKTAWLKVMA